MNDSRWCHNVHGISFKEPEVARICELFSFAGIHRKIVVLSVLLIIIPASVRVSQKDDLELPTMTTCTSALAAHCADQCTFGTNVRNFSCMNVPLMKRLVHHTTSVCHVETQHDIRAAHELESRTRDVFCRHLWYSYPSFVLFEH